MAIIILKTLQEQGKLTLGDILTHSDNGDHEFIGIDSRGWLIMLDSMGYRHFWNLDFGLNTRIIPCPHGFVDLNI